MHLEIVQFSLDPSMHVLRAAKVGCCYVHHSDKVVYYCNDCVSFTPGVGPVNVRERVDIA